MTPILGEPASSGECCAYVLCPEHTIKIRSFIWFNNLQKHLISHRQHFGFLNHFFLVIMCVNRDASLFKNAK